MAASMTLRVVSPERVVYEGDARSLVAPAWDGRVGILPGHASFLTLLGEGPLRIASGASGMLEYRISGGVLKVEANDVTVLASRVANAPAPGTAS